MVNKQVPTYLQTLVPPSIDQISQRTLRSGNHLQVPQSRTSHYQNSFLPRTVSEWNALPNNIKSLPSLNSFKTFLNRNQSPVPSYYFIGERKYQVLHTRLRLGCSSLNADLFRNHVSAIDTCQCGQIETATHYLLLCPIYRNVRTTTIGTIIENINLDILLKGCPLYSEDVNISIFLKVQDFIRKSNRFWTVIQVSTSLSCYIPIIRPHPGNSYPSFMLIFIPFIIYYILLLLGPLHITLFFSLFFRNTIIYW